MWACVCVCLAGKNSSGGESIRASMREHLTKSHRWMKNGMPERGGRGRAGGLAGWWAKRKVSCNVCGAIFARQHRQHRHHCHGHCAGTHTNTFVCVCTVHIFAHLYYNNCRLREMYCVALYSIVPHHRNTPIHFKFMFYFAFAFVVSANKRIVTNYTAQQAMLKHCILY